MYYPGLVSISFRDHTPAKIALAAYKFGLKYVEWGSDIHAPCGDIKQLQFITGLHNTFDISCCSYGTYFRLGHSPISELLQYIEAAKILGTNILRLWAGRKKAADCTKKERDFLFSECRKAAAMAEEHNVPGMSPPQLHRNQGRRTGIDAGNQFPKLPDVLAAKPGYFLRG